MLSSTSVSVGKPSLIPRPVYKATEGLGMRQGKTWKRNQQTDACLVYFIYDSVIFIIMAYHAPQLAV